MFEARCRLDLAKLEVEVELWGEGRTKKRIDRKVISKVKIDFRKLLRGYRYEN